MNAGYHPRLLIVGLNWLGDGVMSMPALAILRRGMPAARIEIAVRAGLAPLWALCPSVDEVLVQPAGSGVLRWAVGSLRRREYDRAYVFPNSFRSALLPYLARIPMRRGVRADGRGWMLTDAVRLLPGPGFEHQMYEYMEIVGLEADRDCWSLPLLRVDPSRVEQARTLLAARGISPEEARLVALFPGAAYGPSKRWPPDRFAAVARRLHAEDGCRSLVFGAPGDAPACAEVARQAGRAALNLAGGTSLPETAALLGLCAAAVSNDSGGMHLAAALGVRVVALFGLTNPARTGPIGPDHRVLAADGWRRARDLPRNSEEARRALETIGVEQVVEAARGILRGRDAEGGTS